MAEMKAFPLKFIAVLLSLCTLVPFGCTKKAEAQSKKNDPPEISMEGLPPVEETRDKIAQEMTAFRNQTRALYNNRKFDELEALAGNLHANKARFGNGSWKIYYFYDCQECHDKEPESMWQLHAQIHKEWIEAKPQSITARVAYANFLVDYAWHARGGGWADTVTQTGWRLFEDRLADALKVLDDSASLKEKCPMWWRVRMTVALGQGWQRAEYEKLFTEAKEMEPEFFSYDVARAWHLMPRWYGEPGEWEAAAEAEAKRPGSLGLEGYARVVIAQSDRYNNIFEETKISWPDTRKGLELLRQKYPDSLQILSSSCKLACLSGDRDLAKQLFEEIGGRMEPNIWKNKNYFIKCRNWAHSE